MSAPTTPHLDELHEALCNELLRLAEREEDLANREAEQVQYWEPIPETVGVHRQCAAALRAAAAELASRAHSQP